MFMKPTLKTATSIACIFMVYVLAVYGQSDSLTAKKHFELARSYSSAGDSRAEGEYRNAIAARGGVYPEAWEWLSRYLAHVLRFNEAATAWRTYLEQTKEKIHSTAFEQLNRLDRAAQLKCRSDKGEGLSIEEILELIRLIDGFGSKGDAIPYAEKAVLLHPRSPKVLLAVADTIKETQKDRALELLNQAIALQPHEPSVYVARGWCYFWAFGNPVEAETDFRKALELSRETDASAWAGLGDSLARQGRRSEAISAYRKYLSVRPESAAHYDGEIRRSIRMLQGNSEQP